MPKTERVSRLFPQRRRKPLAYDQEQAMRKVLKELDERLERKLKEADAIVDAVIARFRHQLQLGVDISQILAHQDAVDRRIQNALDNIRGAK